MIKYHVINIISESKVLNVYKLLKIKKERRAQYERNKMSKVR